MKKTVAELSTFVAGDETVISEVLHPKNEPLNLPYSLAFATLEVGASSKPHILKQSEEVYVIVSGSGTATVGKEEFAVQPGDVVLIPAGVVQFIRNDGDEVLKFYCIVSPPWNKDDEVIVSDHGNTTTL